jgi:hypothetical protein
MGCIADAWNSRLRPGISSEGLGFTRFTYLAFVLSFLLAAAGCGAPGAPQPPSLGIPKPVSDLRAARKGDDVTLTWTASTETTDGELIRKAGKMAVLRSLVGGTSAPQWQTISQLTLPPALKQDQAAQESLKDAVEPLLRSGADFATYSLLTQSDSGKSAGSSNQASVPLVSTPLTPPLVNAVPVPSGISISWDQAWPPQNHTHLTTQYIYRIMRREEGAKTMVVVKDVEVTSQAMTLIDTGIEWQKHYEYWIIPVTLWQGAGKKGEVEGVDSPVVSVFANDTFPPEIPVGLEAVFSGAMEQPAIDLSWTPDTEPDLAGYNVYRHLENQPPVKINSELVKTSAFRDAQVSRGAKYYYSVSAVDMRGNESARSAEASESVPN